MPTIVTMPDQVMTLNLDIYLMGTTIQMIYNGGVLTPKKTKKNQKKPSQFTNFSVATGFFLGFFGFFWFFFCFFWFFLVFLG